MRTGIVVIGHGSPASAGEANEVFCRIGELLKEKAGHDLVETAVLIRQAGFQTVEEAVKKLVDRGAGRITLAPALLSNGVHIRQDIPAEISRLRLQYPGVTFVGAGHIGADPRIADILLERVEQAQRKMGGG